MFAPCNLPLPNTFKQGLFENSRIQPQKGFANGTGCPSPLIDLVCSFELTSQSVEKEFLVNKHFRWMFFASVVWTAHLFEELQWLNSLTASLSNQHGNTAHSCETFFSLHSRAVLWTRYKVLSFQAKWSMLNKSGTWTHTCKAVHHLNLLATLSHASAFYIPRDASPEILRHSSTTLWSPLRPLLATCVKGIDYHYSHMVPVFFAPKILPSPWGTWLSGLRCWF